MTRRFRPGALLALVLGAAALAPACGSRGPAPVVLGAPERFDWVRQPVEFAPPPPRWERQAQNEGGQIGVFFTHRGSVGERIIVAAYQRLADRVRRDSLGALRQHFERIPPDAFGRAVSLARARTEDPVSEREAEVARRINRALDRALTEYSAGRMLGVQLALEEALHAAESYEPDLAEVIGHIRFRLETRREPERYGEVTETEAEVAGLPARVLDYTLTVDERTLACREVYVVARGVAFTASYLGLEENLPVFDAVVASLRFPDPAAAPAAEGS